MASPVLSIVKLGGGSTAPDWIWLSWLPVEAPSNVWSLTWYGPPEMLPAPLPVPYPTSGTVKSSPWARWPPNSMATDGDVDVHFRTYWALFWASYPRNSIVALVIGELA